MKVYYNSSLFSKGKGKKGIRQTVNFRFKYMKQQIIIPYIYKFPQGIVFDLITLLDETKVKEFFDKYGTDDDALSPQQRILAEQEHPYKEFSLSKLWINGQRVEGSISSSSSVYIMGIHEDETLRPQQREYRLGRKASFACQRFCAAYPPTDSKLERVLRTFGLNKIHKFGLESHPVNILLPLDIKLEIDNEGETKETGFRHPKTEQLHKLALQNLELVDYPLENDQRIYITYAEYSVQPSLPEGDVLQFDSSIQYTKKQDSPYSPIATSSIGFIGGPLRQSSSSEDKKEGASALIGCFSRPSFNKDGRFEFIIKGIESKIYDAHIYDVN